MTPELEYLKEEVDRALEITGQLYHPKEIAKVLRNLAREYDKWAEEWDNE